MKLRFNAMNNSQKINFIYMLIFNIKERILKNKFGFK